jgi:hypothetical protein
MSWKCGFSVIEENFEDEKIQSVIDFWTERCGIGNSIDLDTVQKGANSIYARKGLKAPKICYWRSSVSMILAAETLKHGANWVEKNYGKEIMLISNEYQRWLETLPLNFKKRNSRKVFENKFLAGANTLRSSWQPALDKDIYQWVHIGLSNYYNRFFQDSSQQVIYHALNGALEANEHLYTKKMTGHPNPRLDVFNASEHCLYFAKQAIVAYAANLSIPDSPEYGLRLLAKGCHTAILTETECWVSGAAAMVEVNGRGEADCRSGPAVRFHDGSVLYAVNDFPVPELYINADQNMNLESIPYNCGMREAFLECFGVKRYLTESNAVCVAKKRSSQLWNVNVANEVRSILEVDGKITNSLDGAGIHYYESFKQVKSFAEFDDSFDEHMGFTITNQLT